MEKEVDDAQTAIRLGFLINPIAGMGGRVGLKGTDDMVAEAISRGARPVANGRADECLNALSDLLKRESHTPSILWFSCAGDMGADALNRVGFQVSKTVCATKGKTTARDTTRATEALVAAGVDLIIFCGGDGTARDICAVASDKVPVLGIPAGVKMFSGVFGTSPSRTAEIVLSFLKGELTQAVVDVLDLDEDQYREGVWAVRLYSKAVTPFEPSYSQVAKVLVSESTDADAKQDIAEYLREEIDARSHTLVLLGAGSTLQSLAGALGVPKTLLGIDAVRNGQIIAANLDERRLVDLLDTYPDCIAILSPIGAQGFILGRGNLEFSPDVIRRIGIDNLVIAATPAKLTRTPILRVDTGDPVLDAELVGDGYISVVVGYRRHRMVEIAA